MLVHAGAFAAGDRADEAAAGPPQGSGGLVVMTASLEEGVLPGIMRLQVLQACRQLQLQLLEQAPCLEDSSSWVEAFVTNTLRGVQPVGSLLRPAGAPGAAAGTAAELPQQHGPVTKALQQLLARLQELSSME